MNADHNIKITLNNEEREAVRKVGTIVEEFADNMCEEMKCEDCPLAIFCPYTNCADSFEETLNNIANME